MAKYSFEFKMQIVQAYIDGEGGLKCLCKKYGITQPSILRKWVNAFKNLGADGLMRSRRNKNYTFEYKLHVVELYLTSELSYQELANLEGINNPSLITKWVNDFRIAGPDALKPKKKGRKKSLKEKAPKVKSTRCKDEQRTVDISAEYLKQLEDENLKLRIQNAYLKELRRLRLEEETLLKERRGSSTASEENSD